MGQSTKLPIGRRRIVNSNDFWKWIKALAINQETLFQRLYDTAPDILNRIYWDFLSKTKVPMTHFKLKTEHEPTRRNLSHDTEPSEESGKGVFWFKVQIKIHHLFTSKFIFRFIADANFTSDIAMGMII